MSKTFTAQNPATGQAVGAEIAEWDLVQTSAAIKAAESVKAKLASTNPTQRAALLNAIADAIEALAEGEVLEIGQLNPEISGKQLNLQIVETINGTDYDKANIATKAKRAGADGDYIVTSKGENIFTKVSVVVGEPRHFFFEETVRKNTGAASNAIIEALGE